MGDSNLLIDLTIALTVAFIGATVAARLGQSTILGFIAAGVVIGPNTPGFVGDTASVEALADIGIVLLMFAIGVQFSLRDLLRFGRIATLGASTQILLTIGIGYLVGKLLGWGDLEALFFGAVISNSSSTVISKVLGERGEAGTSFGQLGVAWSTVQDLSTIVMVVVFTAVANGEANLGIALVWALVKATAFLVLLLPIGSRVLPWLIERVAAQQNRETFILTVGVVALGTAYGSTVFGFSLALGAFVAGIVVSESDISHQILGEVIPLRDIFAGLFFVAVGMLVDPAFVVSNLHLVAIGVALTVLVKGALVAGILHLARYPAQLSILTAATLAQSAEFSFLLARLGINLNAISSDIFNVLLTSAVISILIAPAVMSGATVLARRVEARALIGPLSEPLDQETTLRGHAVLCGYGRVGSIIGETLRRRGIRFVVIEQSRALVQQLREAGIDALLGTADNHILLERAGVERARVVIVAVPDPLTARRTVDYVRDRQSDATIVVRTHSDADKAALAQAGAAYAVLGEQELALEMTRVTLHRYGVGATETRAILQGIRQGRTRTAESA